MDIQEWKKVGAFTISIGSFFAVLVGLPLMVGLHATDSRLQLRLEIKDDLNRLQQTTITAIQENRTLFVQALRNSEQIAQKEMLAIRKEIVNNRHSVEALRNVMFDTKEPTPVPRQNRDHQNQH